MEFRFPEDLQGLQRIKDRHDLQTRLDSLIQASHLKIRYRYFLRKSKYLYGRCCQCQSYIRYRLQQQEFHISSIQPFHFHDLAKIKFDPIKEFIKCLPPMATRKEAKNITMNRFSISSAQFYYLYRKMIEPHASFQEYLRELDKQQCFIHYEPFGNSTEKPDLMVLVTPQMMKYYEKYGHSSISIDFTYNLFKELSGQGKTYKTGFILGMSFSRRIVPFAFLLAVDQSKETYYRSIKSFGEIMGSLPNIIVTDQTLGAIHSLKEHSENREFEGIHGLDTHHILKNLYVKLKNKDNIKHFANLIKAEDKKKFQILVQTAYDSLQDQEVKLLQRFITNSSSYCISQMPKMFIGRIPSTNPNEKAHDMLKNQVPFAKPLPIVINKKIKLSNYLLSQCEEYRIQKIQLEKYFGYSEIRAARFQLDERLFDVFCQQLSKSLKTELIIQEQLILINDFEDNSKYRLQNGTYEERLVLLCDYSYQVKLGLPCRHQLRYLLVQGSRILDYISDFWKISCKVLIVKQRRVSTGKKTRRNR